MIAVIICSLFFLNTLAVDLIKAKECVTPYNEHATCTPFKECDVISSLLSTIFTPREIQFIKDSKCGCEEGMVCCGNLSDKPYPRLDNCVPVQPLVLSDISDRTICGLDAQTDRIVGGELAKPQEFPWLAALEYINKLSNKNAGIRCGGSIITTRFILTAAHCIIDVEFEIIKVWLGVTNINSEKSCSTSNECIISVEKLNVRRIVLHEMYNSIHQSDDIALLQLENYLQFTKYIRPICLPAQRSFTPNIGTLFTVAGWGVTENGKTSEAKRKVQVPLMDNQLCQDYLSKGSRNITWKQLCVGGERGRDSCEGDSGGPLMYDIVGVNGDFQWIQQGIVSYGSRCGYGRPAVYVKVAPYVEWIKNKMKERTRYLEKGESCRTPRGIAGTCVHINTCPEFFTRILTKAEYYKYIKQSECHTLYGAYICCAKPGSIVTADFNSISGFPNKTTCGIEKEKHGLEDDKTGFPWIAGIEVSTGKRTEIRCLGTVIHSRYIITSIRCIFGDEYDDFEPINVWLGRWTTSQNNTNAVQKIKIKRIIPYPLNSVAKPYFNALILLEKEIQFSDYISPICLDSESLPELRREALTSVWLLNNSSRTESITSSSDTIIKRELPSFNCWDGACVGKEYFSNWTKAVPLGIPIMRRFKDQANGRMQWYLVSVDVWWYTPVAATSYYASIINSLNQLITIISEYS